LFVLFSGTAEERGINKWRRHVHVVDDTGVDNSMRIYDLPFIQKYLDRFRFFRYLPFCPRFSMKRENHTDEVEINDQNAESNKQSNVQQEQYSVDNEKSDNTRL
jgi:hypothetical protein